MKMERDSIVSEVRAIREAYAEEFNYDLRAIWRDLKEQESKGDRKLVSLTPRKARETLTSKR
jgi:hypothetical protein